MVDFTSITLITQLLYVVPTPKPVEVYYQFINPFDIYVWFGCLVMCLSFMAMFVLNNIFIDHIDKNPLDFIIYPICIILEPLLDTYWIQKIKNGSISGSTTIFSVVLGGFLITSFYRSLLLAHLTAVQYDKPPEDIEGKMCKIIFFKLDH